MSVSDISCAAEIREWKCPGIESAYGTKTRVCYHAEP